MRSSDTFLYERNLRFHIYSVLHIGFQKESDLTYLVSSVRSRGFEQCLARQQEFMQPTRPTGRRSSPSYCVLS